MYQSFDVPPTGDGTANRIAALRGKLADMGLDWFLVPHSDAHQNEYLPAREERLAWLTGFTGSAGFALIGRRQAFLYVDGRYTLQAKAQADRQVFEICDLLAQSPATHAQSLVEKGDKIGFDPCIMTIGQEKRWREAMDKAGGELLPVENPVDAVWQDQPGFPAGKAWCHPVKYAGRAIPEKLDSIRKQLAEDDADALLVTDPASVAWAFNLRGSDVVHNPLVLSFAIIARDENIAPVLFVDSAKFSSSNLDTIKQLADIQDYDAVERWLSLNAGGKAFHCDPALVAANLGKAIREADGRIIEKPDPVARLRAIKNTAEIHGARSAHLRDGVAMARFLAWLDRQKAGSVDEIAAARQLERSRRETAQELGSELREIAFDTISGAGANGAIVHYRVTEKSNARLQPDSVYLVDSGGQYIDGTTDITRTVAIGTPPKDAITNATLVLKGHIAIATARFPAGTRGVDLDALARIALWRCGKDYAHGTGHGIGSYLNVHEGPQSLSRRGMVAFEPGMILSNEPGYYREGAYGIRIENLLLVTGPDTIAGGDVPMLGFETLTVCPIDYRLVDKKLMTEAELEWLNTYHQRVRETLAPYLNDTDREWLESATRPL